MSHWTRLHTAALPLIAGFTVYIAVWRPFGLYTTWLAMMAALTAFALTAGHGITNRWVGALIDSRNKISLSRFQMFIWTVIVLSAFVTIALARVSASPLTALDITVPQTLWLLMGISVTSMVASPLIKKSIPEDKLAVCGRKDDASWADMFMGEDTSSADHLDLAKIQMFFFTILVVLAYTVALGSMLRADVLPQGLPDIGDGMLPLLGISHSGYLMSKAASAPKQAPSVAPVPNK